MQRVADGGRAGEPAAEREPVGREGDGDRDLGPLDPWAIEVGGRHTIELTR